MIGLVGGEESMCEVMVHGRQLEYVSDFKKLLFVLAESATGGAECCKKVSSGRKVEGVTRMFLNTRFTI